MAEYRFFMYAVPLFIGKLYGIVSRSDMFLIIIKELVKLNLPSQVRWSDEILYPFQQEQK